MDQTLVTHSKSPKPINVLCKLGCVIMHHDPELSAITQRFGSVFNCFEWNDGFKTDRLYIRITCFKLLEWDVSQRSSFGAHEVKEC